MLQTYVGTWGICGLLKHNETFKTLQKCISSYDKDAGCMIQDAECRRRLKAFQTYDDLPIENGIIINCCKNKKSNPCKSV